jgi:membrane-bound ClpP family serine protease
MLIPPDGETKTKLGALRLFAIANIVILIAGLIIVWATGMIGSDIDWQGWTAIILALLATSLLGSGLMTLAFYSSRSERDETVYHVADEDEPQDPGKTG